jgi:hypothetical protein
MEYLGVLVKDPAYAMPAVFTHYGATVFFGMELHCVANIAQMAAGPNHIDAPPHRIEGYADDPGALHSGFSYREHPAGVAVKAILDHGYVNIDDVAWPQLAVTRDAVTYDVIHRRADGFWKTSVIERRRDCFLDVDDEVVADPVEVRRGDSRAHMGTDHVENICCEPTGGSHFLLLVGGLDAYVHWLDTLRGPAGTQEHRTRGVAGQLGAFHQLMTVTDAGGASVRRVVAG